MDEFEEQALIELYQSLRPGVTQVCLPILSRSESYAIAGIVLRARERRRTQ